MSTPQMTTPEALRSALASTIACSAQELQEAVGQVVVATAAELPASAAVGPADRSLFDAPTSTLVLLADRIPAGQEGQALAAEIERHHGRQVAQAVVGDRAAELLGAGLNRGKLLDLDAPALEVLVDIARTIGERRFVSGGDSRDNWRDMCEWADEFQAKFESNPEAGETYMEDVEAFAIAKAEEAGWFVCQTVESAVQPAPLRLPDSKMSGGVASVVGDGLNSPLSPAGDFHALDCGASLRGGLLTLDNGEVVNLALVMDFLKAASTHVVPQSGDAEHEMLTELIDSAGGVLRGSGLSALVLAQPDPFEVKFAEMPKNGYYVAITPVFEQIERHGDWRQVNATTLNGAKRAAVTLATSGTFTARVATCNEVGEFRVVAEMHNSSAITRRRAVWRDSKVVLEGGESRRLDDTPSP